MASCEIVKTEDGQEVKAHANIEGGPRFDVCTVCGDKMIKPHAAAEDARREAEDARRAAEEAEHG
jgi:hypothetical protein